MAKSFVCVEVGDSIVKVSVALGTEKKRKVKDAFFFEAPEDTVDDGMILDTQRFSGALTRELENHKCNGKEVFFTVNSSRVVTREVRMPLLTDAKMAVVVENNKDQYFPMDLEDQTVMFRVMSREKKGADKGCNVLVIAMPKMIAIACQEACEAGDFKLKGVDAACNSLVDGVSMLKQGQITGFVNVEGSVTNMAFMRGSELLLQRSIPNGGDEMLQAYSDASESALSYVEALEDLCGINAEDHIRGKLDDDDVTGLLERLVGGISRSVAFFNTEKGGGVTNLVLTGTCGAMLGIDDLVEQATGIPTMQMIQLSTATSLRSISQTPSYYMSTMYAGASTVNFAVDKDSKKGKRKAGKQEVDLPTVVLIFLLMVVFATYWGYSAVLEHGTMEDDLAKLEKEVADMDYLDVLAATHATYENSKTSLLNFTQLTANPNEQLLDFLSELEAKMPSEVLILSAACTKTSVSMNFVVSSLVEAATVISRMRTFESIGNLQVSGLGMSQVSFDGDQYSSSMQDGFDEVTFSIVCTYGENPYTSYINPYANALGIPAVPNMPVVPDAVPEGEAPPVEGEGTGEDVGNAEEAATDETA